MSHRLPKRDYSKAKDAMFDHTDTEDSPWWVIDGDDKRRARLNCIQHLLGSIPYTESSVDQLVMPPRQEGTYVRPPEHEQSFVVNHYD